MTSRLLPHSRVLCSLPIFNGTELNQHQCASLPLQNQYPPRPHHQVKILQSWIPSFSSHHPFLPPPLSRACPYHFLVATRVTKIQTTFHVHEMLSCSSAQLSLLHRRSAQILSMTIDTSHASSHIVGIASLTQRNRFGV